MSRKQEIALAHHLFAALSDAQLAQLVAVAGPSSSDEIIPYSVYTVLAEYLRAEDIQIPVAVAEVDAEKVVADYEVREREKGAYKWQFAEVSSLHFFDTVEEIDEENGL